MSRIRTPHNRGSTPLLWSGFSTHTLNEVRYPQISQGRYPHIRGSTPLLWSGFSTHTLNGVRYPQISQGRYPHIRGPAPTHEAGVGTHTFVGVKFPHCNSGLNTHTGCTLTEFSTNLLCIGISVPRFGGDAVVGSVVGDPAGLSSPGGLAGYHGGIVRFFIAVHSSPLKQYANNCPRQGGARLFVPGDVCWGGSPTSTTEAGRQNPTVGIPRYERTPTRVLDSRQIRRFICSQTSLVATEAAGHKNIYLAPVLLNLCRSVR